VATLQENGNAFSDLQCKADLINKAFTTVFTSEDTSTMSVLDGTPYPEMSSIDVSTKGIAYLLENLAKLWPR